MYLNFCFCFTSIPVDVTSSAVGLKIFAITAVFKKYQSMIKNERRKYNNIVLSAETKLNIVEVLIFKVLIDSNISHDGFFSVNIVLREINDMKG